MFISEKSAGVVFFVDRKSWLDYTCAQMADFREAGRIPSVLRPQELWGLDEATEKRRDEIFLDEVCELAVSRASNVEVQERGVTISTIIRLDQAVHRLSPETLDARIGLERFKIAVAEEEIGRLEEIRTRIHGNARQNEGTSS